MAKKEYFAIVDTETTMTDKVFDFACIIVDRKGVIHHQMAVIVQDFINDDLFYDNNNPIWSKQNAIKKKTEYENMIYSGQRIVASVNAINRWLDKAIAKYNPTLTAYNLTFDAGKCQNSGIDLTGFSNRFCLWHTAVNVLANTKDYKAFVMENHYFGNRTKIGNMVMKTNAEIMAHYILGDYKDEPHTALEDAIYFELPIFKIVVNKKGWKQKTDKPYNWRDWIMKDHFKVN